MEAHADAVRISDRSQAWIDLIPSQENAQALGEGEPNIDNLIEHDLNDIYLLLDHLSGRADRNIACIELDHGGQKQNLIDAVCKIKWPAAVGQAKWEQAAILFKARDKLNQLAAPATGLTIAYTLLVAPHYKRFRERFFETSENHHCGEEKPESYGYPHCFAQQAYPHLVESARRCRKWIDHLPLLLVFALIVTSLLSWYVGYGKFILLRIEQLNAQRAEIARAVDVVEKLQPGSASSNKPDQRVSSEAWLQDEPHLVQRCNAAKRNSPASVELRRACVAAAQQLERKRRAADEALTEWTSYAIWLPGSAAKFAAFLGGPIPKQMNDQLTAPEREEQWSANLLAILGNYVLPMLYGLLGASAAAMMNLKQKIRSSRLSPRDRRMNHVQLVLGVITGACIGLFFTAAGVGSEAPLSGTSVPLSASALSFLAGFGVEGVFKKLENIMITVFGGQANTPVSQPHH
jgi:hypothetical protein